MFDREDQIMTVREVSEFLRVHPSTIYRMLKKKMLPSFRVGSDWRFSKAEIDKFTKTYPKFN